MICVQVAYPEGHSGKHREGGRGRRKARKGCMEAQIPPRILGSVLLGLWGTVWNKPQSCPSEGQGCWGIYTPAPMVWWASAALGHLKSSHFQPAWSSGQAVWGWEEGNQRKLSGRGTQVLGAGASPRATHGMSECGGDMVEAQISVMSALVYAWHCFKDFTNITTLKPYYNPMRQID